MIPTEPLQQIRIDLPETLKRQLYARLALEGKTLRQWITEQVVAYTTPERILSALEEVTDAS